MNAKLTLSWKVYVNELWNVDIELKISCQWVVESWYRVKKLMSITNIKLTLSWKAHVKELSKLTLSWKPYINEQCKIDIKLKNSCQWAMPMN